MSLLKHFNLLYSGTTPLNLGDRYYSQDLIRDLLYSWDNTGQTARRILGTFPALLMGGVVTAGAGAHCLDITETWGICNYSVEHPDTFAALPPSKTSSDIARLVNAAVQNELDTSGLTTPATADGATPNYVKLRYKEANGNTRTRARAAGTYAYEVTPSYQYYCDAVAPTDYDVLLATVTITAPGVVTIVSSATPYNVKKVYDDLDVIERIHGTSTETIAAATATRTILDTDTVHTFFADCSQRAQTLVLPTLAANLNRVIGVKVITAGGAVSLTPEGAETIDGVNAAFVMQSSGDHCTVVAQTTGWRILSAYAKLDTGWINTADWSNRHFGSQTVTYNAGAGSYIVGETITEQTSNNTAIIMADTGAILTVKNVTGTGIFINGRNLTGSTSGCIRTVNGNTKNQDSNVLHNAGVTLPNLKARVLMSFNATGTDAIAMETNDAAQDGTNYWGKTILYIDTNNIKVQTGDSLNYIDENGVFQSIDTEDYSYKVIVERII